MDPYILNFGISEIRVVDFMLLSSYPRSKTFSIRSGRGAEWGSLCHTRDSNSDREAHSVVTIPTELFLPCMFQIIRISDLYLVSRLQLEWLVRS